jgi:hypothetical protein
LNAIVPVSEPRDREKHCILVDRLDQTEESAKPLAHNSRQSLIIHKQAMVNRPRLLELTGLARYVRKRLPNCLRILGVITIEK